MIEEYQARRDLVMQKLGDMPDVECLPPQGAFYAFPDVSRHYTEALPDSVAFSESLLDQANVAVVPGAAFGADRHIRISFACSREMITQGLERITGALTKD